MKYSEYIHLSYNPETLWRIPRKTYLTTQKLYFYSALWTWMNRVDKSFGFLEFFS